MSPVQGLGVALSTDSVVCAPHLTGFSKHEQVDEEMCEFWSQQPHTVRLLHHHRPQITGCQATVPATHHALLKPRVEGPYRVEGPLAVAHWETRKLT
jgi:hypothetical protein